MKDNFRSNSKSIYVFGAAVLVFGLAFLMAVAPAFASTAAQVATGSATAVGTAAAPTTAATAAAPTTAATAAAPTTAAGAPTTVATLAAPAAGVGTPTALVPVTGADLTQSGDQTRVLFEVLAGLAGLLLVAYGVFSRLAKRYNR